ncbi:MAG: FkbM family methyltransferase [Armatimonadetes bacterium]|nr:FkbM family methyltransferase [Armatimonadota bacterium]
MSLPGLGVLNRRYINASIRTSWGLFGRMGLTIGVRITRTRRTAARQFKAAWYLTTMGVVDRHDAARLWLVALGMIRRPVVVRPLSLRGHSLIARPWTTDLRTLKDTFCHGYHRPDLREVRTILDLGANVGYCAADLAILYPDARILAVEMDSSNYQCLVQNTSGLPVGAIHAAVWTHEDGVRYVKSLDSDAFAAVSTGAPTVQSVCMDTLIAELGGYVDYVNMDIEGGESQLITSEAKWLNGVG